MEMRELLDRLEEGFPTKLKTAAVRFPEGTMAKSASEIAKVGSQKKYAPGGKGSAIDWIQYYINRAGKSLDPKNRVQLEKAKRMLQKGN